MALPPWLARFNRRVTNRVTPIFASRVPGFGIVIHTGRRSGHIYRTPINVFRDGDDYIIALTYGAERDWVRNVLAANGCELLTRGRYVRLINPHIVTDPTRRWAPLPARPILRLLGVENYMRLTRVPAANVHTAADAPLEP
jgi:deazaflavin-dependent oxidoreductase (nitroreductase family)